MRARPTGIALRLNVTWRRFGTRISSAFLITAALGCMLVAKINPALTERLQVAASDFFTPALSFLSTPMASIRDTAATMTHIVSVYRENGQLKDDNQKLLAWRDAALRLEAENNKLRAQLHVQPDPQITQITARVIGDPAGGFVRSLLVAAGSSHGVEKGQPAMIASDVPGDAGSGALVGRVIQAGAESARLLLITDVNSHIPVMLEQSHDHAIMAGDNSDQPLLLYLPPSSSVTVGERIVTSGNDGVLPAGLAVAVVVSTDNSVVHVQPLADLSNLDFVQILKYRAVQPLLTPEAATVSTIKPHQKP